MESRNVLVSRRPAMEARLRGGVLEHFQHDGPKPWLTISNRP